MSALQGWLLRLGEVDLGDGNVVYDLGIRDLGGKPLSMQAPRSVFPGARTFIDRRIGKPQVLIVVEKDSDGTITNIRVPSLEK